MIYPHTFEEKIGMTEIRGLLNGHCLSTLGEQRVQEMKFLTDCAQLRELHQQVGELARLLLRPAPYTSPHPHRGHFHRSG